MKRLSNKILILILLVSLAVGSVSLYFYGGLKNLLPMSNSKNNGPVTLKNVKESTIPINDLKNINMDLSFGDATIASYDEKDIKVKIEVDEKLKLSDYEISANKSGDSLDIKLLKNSSPKINVITRTTSKITVFIPKNYTNDMKIKDSLGDISIKDVKLNNFQCIIDKGNFTGENVQYNKGKIEESLGDIKLAGVTGELDVDSSKGNVDINYASFNNNLKIKSSLGNIKLGLPKESKFNIDATTSLGDLNVDFPILSTNKNGESKKISGAVNGGGSSLVIENSSGDISVSRNN